MTANELVSGLSEERAKSYLASIIECFGCYEVDGQIDLEKENGPDEIGELWEVIDAIVRENEPAPVYTLEEQAKIMQELSEAPGSSRYRK